jgi:hypothetical protein
MHCQCRLIYHSEKSVLVRTEEGKGPFGNLGPERQICYNVCLRNRMEEHWLDSSGSEQGLVQDTCEYGNKSSGL